MIDENRYMVNTNKDISKMDSATLATYNQELNDNLDFFKRNPYTNEYYHINSIKPFIKGIQEQTITGTYESERLQRDYNLFCTLTSRDDKDNEKIRDMKEMLDTLDKIVAIENLNIDDEAN